jgi:aryl-alcohol dehydrogenase-like predicted oxidoreductase
VCLGGNMFGWTTDEPASRAVLDGYADAGGNFIDTSNSYLVEHGRSETIIGRWMADRGNRDQIVVATKVAAAADRSATCGRRPSSGRRTPRWSGCRPTVSTCTTRTSTIPARPWAMYC